MNFSKHYINGFLNSDDEPNAVGEGEAISVSNLRFGTSDNGQTGRWETIGSTALLQNAGLPAGTNTFIGGAEEEAGRYFVFCIHNSNGDHKIFLYYAPENQFYLVMSGPNLNFSRNRLVDGVVMNDTFFFTDNFNQPRCIHLPSALRFFNPAPPLPYDYTLSSALSATDILLIRKPFALPPSIRKEQDTGQTLNRIATESFQFAVQYIYWTGEKSVLSPHSRASKLNAETENYNYISVALPASEKIPQEVRFVRLIVIIGSTKAGFVIKEWDRKKDAAAITDHNSGNPLTYAFYNNVVGEAVSSAELVQPFHSVPLLSKTVEAARNRVFLGNNLEGYDTPAITSLSLSLEDSGEVDNNYTVFTIQGAYRMFDAFGAPTDAYYGRAAYAIFANIGGRTGYFIIPATNTVYPNANPDDPDTPPPNLIQQPLPLPTSVDLNALEYVGEGGAITWFFRVYDSSRPIQEAIVTPVTGSIVVTGVTDDQNSQFTQYKAGGEYHYGVVFYDEALRKSGVVTGLTLRKAIPDRDFGMSVAVPVMNWALNNSGAAGEIPAWAHYYSIVRTLNLKTRSFIQGYDEQPRYATKNDAGEYVVDTTKVITYDEKVVAIALDNTYLLKAGLGYTFTEGDICVLHRSGTAKVELPVIGTQGKHILLKARDIGALTGAVCVYEIYTPYTPSANEPFFEVGQMYPVLNPGTDQRTYATTAGVVSGDAFLLTRSLKLGTYVAEAMCPNDKFFQRWDTDAGRANYVVAAGQYRNKTGVRFSNTFVAGTDTNGLCAFEALNQTNLPLEMGELNALKLTSKVQGEGTVMLAVGASQTASLYLGEVQVSNSDGSSYFIKDVGVIGQVNVLRGDYGTQNPESITHYKGNVWWMDVRKGVVVQYSANGLDVISDFKFRRFAARYCARYQQVYPETIEAFGYRPFIFGGVDPFHEELLFALPKLEAAGRTLPDYDTNVPYPYDMLDYAGKVVVYKLGASKWQGQYTFKSEGFLSLGSSFYDFLGGELYRHNSTDGYGVIHGETVKGEIAFVCNTENAVKVFKSFAVEASHAPEWVHLQSEYPYVAASEIVSFKEREGIWYAPIQRDRLTPGSGTYALKQLKGEDLRGKALLIVLRWDSGSRWFRLATVGYNISKGQV